MEEHSSTGPLFNCLDRESLRGTELFIGHFASNQSGWNTSQGDQLTVLENYIQCLTLSRPCLRYTSGKCLPRITPKLPHLLQTRKRKIPKAKHQSPRLQESPEEELEGPQPQQVSCDWWRVGHVTTVIISDWCSWRGGGVEGREEQGLELSTNIREVSECLDKASTISSSLKAPTGI